MTAEVDIGSATSWGRPSAQWYMVRIRRGDKSEIIAYGLTLDHASTLAERLTKLLA